MEEQKNRKSNQHIESSVPDTIPSFLLKTYEILENEKYQDIISWTKSGEGFIVKRVKEFADNILPIYFRHSNYTSFVRQLNMYDFHKTRQENHENAFKNIMFKRGYKHLLKDIQRKDYKKNKENTKEPVSSEKSTIEKPKENPKNQKISQSLNDGTSVVMSKLSEMNAELEMRALILASLTGIPQKELEVIKLLDVLFEAKRMQREILQKMTSLQGMKPLQKTPVIAETQRMETKIQWPTTEAKTSLLQNGKQDKLGTYSTLFNSFRMVS